MPENPTRQAVALALESVLQGAANPSETLKNAKDEIESLMLRTNDDPEHLALLRLIHEELIARLKAC